MIYSHSDIVSAQVALHFADIEYKRARAARMERWTRDYMDRLRARHSAMATYKYGYMQDYDNLAWDSETNAPIIPTQEQRRRVVTPKISTTERVA